MVPREDITFASHGETCAAWYWPSPPEAGDEVPCVVLGHGFSCTKEARLDAYAEKFAAAGYAALAFDYRHFGGSTGEPRELLDIPMQLQDWKAAVGFARDRPGVDPERIVLWGTSFSGGHVLETAADDQRVAATISQAPHTDGPATMKALGAPVAAGALAVGWADRLGAARGRDPIYLPREGSAASKGLRRLYPDDFEPRTRVTARAFTQVPGYSPGRRAPEIACPLLVQVASRDEITPAAPALRASGWAPRGHARAYPVVHFDIYVGAWFERAIADQLAFLAEHL